MLAYQVMRLFTLSLMTTSLLVVLLLAACRPPENTQSSTGSRTAEHGIQLRIETNGDPRIGVVPVTVYMLKEGEGVSGASIRITGDMTHAGMVPVIVEALEQESGLYRADDFEFNMAGDWILTAEITLPDGMKITDSKAYSVAR